jgi:anti-sigma B factor antagonist
MTMSSQLHRYRLEVEDIGDVTVVHFTNKKLLDEQEVQITAEQLFSLVEELGRCKLILNFRNVEYISSALLGKLITLNKKAIQRGGRVVFCGIDPQIYEVFEICGLNRLFDIQRDDDPDDGLAGALSRLIPPKPSDGRGARLQPPSKQE